MTVNKESSANHYLLAIGLSGNFSLLMQGSLSDGAVIAVKLLSSKSKQGNREFVNEIGMISALQHPNLVKLYGCCVEGNQLRLVYEYMENNCLSRALFGELISSFYQKHFELSHFVRDSKID